MNLTPIAISTRLTSRTAFVDEHPGGSKILKRVAGKDASKQFWKYHNESVLKKYGSKLQIGTVKDAAKLWGGSIWGGERQITEQHPADSADIITVRFVE
jgi:cytochrome b involved in lipid metabolism